MQSFNKIILGFIVFFSIPAAEAQDTKSMFANAQPTKRNYNDNEIILPNFLQYENIGAAGTVLDSKVVDQLIQISWQTKKEINTSHFELQRSEDGKTFDPIETITAGGISQNRRDYSTTDTPYNVITDAFYYRIKSVFVNGKEAFTTILPVDLSWMAQASATNYL